MAQCKSRMFISGRLHQRPWTGNDLPVSYEFMAACRRQWVKGMKFLGKSLRTFTRHVAVTSCYSRQQRSVVLCVLITRMAYTEYLFKQGKF